MTKDQRILELERQNALLKATLKALVGLHDFAKSQPAGDGRVKSHQITPEDVYTGKNRREYKNMMAKAKALLEEYK